MLKLKKPFWKKLNWLSLTLSTLSVSCGVNYKLTYLILSKTLGIWFKFYENNEELNFTRQKLQNTKIKSLRMEQNFLCTILNAFFF